MADLSRKRDRERLSIRREPYWQRLAKGAYLGFRAGPNTWLARFRGRDGKQQYESLGDHVEYDEAKRLAEAWLSRLAASAVRSVKRDTVRAALETYLADLKRQYAGHGTHLAMVGEVLQSMINLPPLEVSPGSDRQSDPRM